MVGSVRVKERFVRRAPLAVRITDMATGRPVEDGLEVISWPIADPADRRHATAITAAGVCGWHHLAAKEGLAAFEDGTSPRREWFESPVAHAGYDVGISVGDPRRRYLPATRLVRVPVSHAADIALSRSPSSPPPAGFLAVAATLRTESGAPAAWAVLEASIGTYTTGGVADAQGTIVLPIARAVPPTSAGSPTKGPEWTVTLRVRFRVADQFAIPGAAAEDPPDLVSLFTQRHASIRDGGPFLPSVLRTIGAGGIEAVASSPPPAPSLLVVRPVP